MTKCEPLAGQSKQIIRNIVGRIHVSTSVQRVKEVLCAKIPKCKKGIMNPVEKCVYRKMVKFAAAEHKRNGKMYTAVMSGRIR